MRQLEDAVAQALSGGSRMETAPAKINLALHVLSRRADGLHLIDSLAVFAEFADLVSAVASTSGRHRLTLDGPFADELELLCRANDNLALRAAAELHNAGGKRSGQPVDLILTKRIPIAGGLGGGSADAAATLRLLNRHWSLGFNDERLARLGVELGADVPMCISSKPVRALGIGERLAPVAGMPRLPVLLVNPSVALSTASVYRHLDDAERTPLPPLPNKFGSVIAVVIWLRQTRNDLSAPARSITGLADLAVKVLSADPECLFARMSGSGPTAFGIFPKLSTAERAADRIRRMRPNWWVMATETIGS